ncbi:MAG: hypothetical protein E7526_03510 [Ruminococcaceae bacterium]|nr:hypothetical protein [Oscillospiraceae bacterium]
MISLKTEIIYLKCATDFEFEFNLNAAVQMRLFTECPADDKAFLSALSLAVSRSRAIIITSKFDEALITKLAGSIGFKTETIVPEEYGITKMETDKLITGGVPLVTEDGIYAGIILESGPQSLIIITNERKTRKALMNKLVHTYLLDVANSVNSAPVVAETNTDATVDTEVVEETVVSDDVTDTITDVVTDDITDAVTTDTVESATEEVVVTTESGNEDVIEDPVIYGLDDADDVEDEIPTAQPKKRSMGIFTAILAIILFLLVAFIVYSLIIDPFLNNISLEENFRHIFGFLFK